MTLKIMRDFHRLALLAALTAAATYSQEPQQPQPMPARAPVDVTRKIAPNATPNAKAEQSPAARYSPLAAQGGYRGQGTTWYDALFHSVNPKNINWGMKWEQRRAAFLENTIANKYFVSCAFLVLSFYAALVAIGWIVWEHKKDIRLFRDGTREG